MSYFTATRQAAVVEAHGQVSAGIGRRAVTKDIAGALASVLGRETQSGTVQKPHHVERHQHQRSHQRFGHTRVDAHVAVLEGKSGVRYW